MEKKKLIQELFVEDHNIRTVFAGSPVRDQDDNSIDKVLWFLSNAEEAVHPTDICKVLGVTTPRVTTILNDMEKQGLIERSICSDDRRKMVVVLTDAGSKLIAAKNQQAVKWITKVVEAIGTDKAEVLLGCLRTMEDLKKNG